MNICYHCHKNVQAYGIVYCLDCIEGLKKEYGRELVQQAWQELQEVASCVERDARKEDDVCFKPTPMMLDAFCESGSRTGIPARQPPKNRT